MTTKAVRNRYEQEGRKEAQDKRKQIRVTFCYLMC